MPQHKLERICGIYKITSPTNKIYIGQSRHVILRKHYYGRHACKNQKRLYHSLEKYSFSAHIFEIIFQTDVDCDQSILDEREIYFMKLFAETNELLNTREGGYKGKHSAESIAKMKRSQAGKIRPNFAGRKHTLESKEKTRQKMLNRKFSPETITRMQIAGFLRYVLC